MTDRYELARIIRDANCLDVTNGKYDDILEVEDFLPEADAVLASEWLRDTLRAEHDGGYDEGLYVGWGEGYLGGAFHGLGPLALDNPYRAKGVA